MRNSTFKSPGMPLKRTGFAVKQRKPMNRGVATLKRSGKPMRSRRTRMTPIRKSAQGEECTIRLPGVCNGRTDTTVLCHENTLEAGKGMGLKAPDTEAAYGCACCHDVVDGRAPRPPGMNYEVMRRYFRKGIEITQKILARKGLVGMK